ncbi:MAG: PLP-dependent aminotransferase family protein [Dehalococcoidia bacterium]|nr:PLP-dependent aminotransferase family protein [Dehalococcoidia bacterium]
MSKEKNQSLSFNSNESSFDQLFASIVDKLPINTSLSPLRYDLNAGVPDRDSLPATALLAATEHVLSHDAGGALTYGGQQGYLPLREWIAARTSLLSKIETNANQITLTSGSAHGLQNVALTFLDPNDTVILGAPTYPGAIRTFQAREANIVTVPQDTEGLIPDKLLKTINNLKEKSIAPKLLYLIPTYDNPTGTTLPLERREAIIKIAHDNNILIIEDEAYVGLDFDGPPPPSLYAIAEGRGVVQLGTFSKTIASGLRVGWITSSESIIKTLVHMRFDNGASPFLHRIVLHFLESGEYLPHVTKLQSIYRDRRDTTELSLRKHASTFIDFTKPNGGFFFWLNLKDPLTANQLRSAAMESNVAVTSGTTYFFGSGGENKIRLVFSALPPTDLENAVEILGNVMRTIVNNT